MGTEASSTTNPNPFHTMSNIFGRNEDSRVMEATNPPTPDMPLPVHTKKKNEQKEPFYPRALCPKCNDNTMCKSPKSHERFWYFEKTPAPITLPLPIEERYPEISPSLLHEIREQEKPINTIAPEITPEIITNPEPKPSTSDEILQILKTVKDRPVMAGYIIWRMKLPENKTSRRKVQSVLSKLHKKGLITRTAIGKYKITE